MRNFTMLLLVGVVMPAAAVLAEAQRTQPVKQVSHNTPEGGTFAVAGSISPVAEASTV